ncbi:MAG: hypothetical protein U0527_08830 [Candidatus Eisenbacteria bacterium]
MPVESRGGARAGITAPLGSAEAVDAIPGEPPDREKDKDAYADYAKVRNELTAGLNGRHYQVGYYVSSERDYFAQQLKAQFDREFFAEPQPRSVRATARTIFDRWPTPTRPAAVGPRPPGIGMACSRGS